MWSIRAWHGGIARRSWSRMRSGFITQRPARRLGTRGIRGGTPDFLAPCRGIVITVFTGSCAGPSSAGSIPSRRDIRGHPNRSMATGVTTRGAQTDRSRRVRQVSKLWEERPCSESTVGWTLSNYFKVPQEERGLDARFGEAYRDYQRRVPRWLGKIQRG